MSADGLVGVEARHLAALQAIAEERSFSRAAERLGYAQSAVSQQIATLERAVGLKLVERPGGPRPVSLTEAGEVVLRHADRLLARLGALRADLDQLVAGESGTIRVGTFQSAGARILPGVDPRVPRALARGARGDPRGARRVAAARRRGRRRARPHVRLDGAVPCPRSSTSECCSRTATCCSSPPGSPYRGRAGVTLQELDGLDVVEPPVGVSCSTCCSRAPGRPPGRVAPRRCSAPTTTSRSCAWSAPASGTRSCPSSRPSRASTPTSRSCRCDGEFMVAAHRDLLAPRPLPLARRPRRSSRSRARSARRSCSPSS